MFQLCFNFVSTLFQLCFNFVSTLFQLCFSSTQRRSSRELDVRVVRKRLSGATRSSSTHADLTPQEKRSCENLLGTNVTVFYFITFKINFSYICYLGYFPIWYLKFDVIMLLLKRNKITMFYYFQICFECGKGFISSQKLKQHIRYKHWVSFNLFMFSYYFVVFLQLSFWYFFLSQFEFFARFLINSLTFYLQISFTWIFFFLF